MRFVLLGDIHVFSLWVHPWRLFNKRIIGQTNLWFNRRRHFLAHTLPNIVQHIHHLKPDAILCTGDFTTTSWHAEFKQILTLFEDLFNTFPTYITPGNHDRYTPRADKHRRFDQYLGKWAHTRNPQLDEITDQISLIRLDPTQANPIHACGRVGTERLHKLTGLLQAIPEQNLPLIMSHYPIGTPPDIEPEAPLHGLLDAPQLTQTLADTNRPILYLHGHVHQPWLTPHQLAPNLTLLNAGAPVMKDKQHPLGQGFWEITLNPNQQQHRAGIQSATQHIPTANNQFHTVDMLTQIHN